MPYPKRVLQSPSAPCITLNLMPLPIYRLRRWLVAITLLFTAVIAGMYLYARLRQRSVLKGFPGKIGYDIKQTASGFQFSKSESGRTVFTIHAKDVKEFKLNGHAELHDVSIILYGRDTSRFDQIYGDNFTYDPQSGNVTAHGEVQIDLQANPTGGDAPDQATPRELKNPIHLKTRDMIFNRDSGDASTDARVDFRTPQATGWAVGVHYSAKMGALTLATQVHVTLSGPDAAMLYANHGLFTRDPHEIVLDNPRMERQAKTLQSDQATFFLGPENEVQRVLAIGNVNAETKTKPTEPDADQMHARADQADLLLTDKHNLLRTATLTGNVHVERIGSQPMQGDAGSAILDFLGQNQLQKIHAADGVRLTQHSVQSDKVTANSSPPASPPDSTPQDYDIAAPIIDFFVADGSHLDRAVTSGAAQITISPAESPERQSPSQKSPATSATASAQRTVITAGKFDAKFAPTPDGSSRLASVHGAPDAKIVNSVPGLPDRISTSRMLDAKFLPEGGIASIIQQGSVAYTDNQPPEKRTQAWADKALYTPADRVLVLTGSPRVSEGSMVTTAKIIRINRDTDDAFADGDVKSTYSELTEQPSGALLASASPIHVTSATMTAHNSPAIALYQGNARLWQDANIVEAPSIQFDRDRRFLIAQGTKTQPVSTVLVQTKLPLPGAAPFDKVQPTKAQPTKVQPADPQAGGEYKAKIKSEEKSSDASPVAITSARLTYADAERLAHYEGGVVAKGSNFTASASTMDAYLLPRSQVTNQTSSHQSLTGPGQLDHMVAEGNVVVLQPGRRADGKKLVYTASDDKFVLTGGPPSIFDAEQGKITGVSLTFFRGDDRVLVEGEASTPVVTQTRVAK
jgi:lipopolysaccharide export system protein LptA